MRCALLTSMRAEISTGRLFRTALWDMDLQGRGVGGGEGGTQQQRQPRQTPWRPGCCCCPPARPCPGTSCPSACLLPRRNRTPEGDTRLKVSSNPLILIAARACWL